MWHPNWQGRRQYWETVNWQRVPEGDIAVGLFRKQNDQGWNNYWYLLRRIGDEQINYQLVLAQSFLVTPTGSLQTTTAGVDASWNNANNTVECIGAGGSGGAHSGNGTSVGNATGGGGGAYSRIANFVIATPGQTTIQWEVGTGGPTTTATPGNAVGGTLGGTTWFNAASDPGVGTDNSKCSAKGGGAGKASATTVTQTGAAGGATASSWGQTKFAGGNGGSVDLAVITATGGGGAGGTTGAGVQGVGAGAAGATNGGAGGTVSGGTAGTGNTGTGSQTGTNGGNGTGIDATHGAGGGGGGGRSTSTATTGHGQGGVGGNYGGGGGGGQGGGTVNASTGGAGIGGLIVLTWTPTTTKIITGEDSNDSQPNPNRPRQPALSIEQQNLLLSTLAPTGPAADTTHILRSPVFARLPDSPQKAKIDDFINSTIRLPVVVAADNTKIFRGPLFARLPDPRIVAKQEYVANLLPLRGTVVVTVQFHQDDWPSAARARPTAAEQPIERLSPLLTPNPASPFNQYEWRSLARVSISLKSDVYDTPDALLRPNPSSPFNQDLWENAARAAAKATGEALGGDTPLLTPNPARPFAQLDWYQIRSTQKARVDEPYNLTITLPQPTVAVAFKQLDWLNAVRGLPPQKSDTYRGPHPLLSPNPSRPFTPPELAIKALSPQPIKSDIFVNLLPLNTPAVVTNPFAQFDWTLAARPGVPQQSYVYGLNLNLPIPPPAPPIPEVTDTIDNMFLPVNCVLGDGTNEPEKFKSEIDQHPPNVRGTVKLGSMGAGRISGGEPSYTSTTKRMGGDG